MISRDHNLSCHYFAQGVWVTEHRDPAGSLAPSYDPRISTHFSPVFSSFLADFVTRNLDLFDALGSRGPIYI